MKTRKMTIAVSVLVFLAPFSVAVFLRKPLGAMDLVSMLTSQLVTEPQAKGGAGSLFDMAKGMLPGRLDGWHPFRACKSLSAAPAVSESTS
ncbi:MAG: hypothetical protein R2875_03870 [Desulfobacterales bacterium]